MNKPGVTKPRIGLLLGDPTGIGPEVAAKLVALPETVHGADILIIGDRRIYKKGAAVAGAASALEAAPEFLGYPGSSGDYPIGRVSAAAGEYALETLRLAVETWQRGTIDAILYAPLNKQAMKLAGLEHEDELHYFADLLGYSGVISEINVCGGLWTSRVTSHVPLSEVAGLITAEKICAVTLLLDRALRAGGVTGPRIAVAALNPHAGEGGLLGKEEITVIQPAIERLRAEGMEIAGPLPADTLFIAARRGDYDGVVTMYHDQGQIAMKLMGFDRGVTVSGGLPAAITTPAHGTAFDIAGKGVADVGAMAAAFTLVLCPTNN